ncbi:hypothetical protein BH11MYX4_BH11MYX4_38930 [soil metagenome]
MLSGMARPLALAPVLLVALLATRAGRSQAPPGGAPKTGAASAAAPPDATALAPGETVTRPLADLQNALPPPTNIVYLKYGVAITSEVVTAAGPICDNVALPCILGPGGGLAIRAGWRGTGPIYLGGAYELSKQDPQKLLRLAILQQARGEGRYYFVSGRDIEPYVHGSAGVAGYGNEWGVDTWGPAVSLGGGVEAQISRRTVVGLALNYRFIYFQEFQDSTGAARAAGVAQLFGLDLVLEQRDPIFTGR